MTFADSVGNKPCSSCLTQQEPCSSSLGGWPEKTFDEQAKSFKIKRILDTVSKELIVSASKNIKGHLIFSVENFGPDDWFLLVKHDYSVLSQPTNELGSTFYSFDNILARKQMLYPGEIEISKTFANVTL